MPVYHCASAYTGEGLPSPHPDSGSANCNKGGTLHRRGLGAPSSVAGELLSHLGLGQTVSPGNVFRAECDARRSFTLTDLLHWFNKLHLAAETLLHMASYSCLQSINRCRGAKTCKATLQNREDLILPGFTGGKSPEAWVFGMTSLTAQAQGAQAH